ncbi:MAG: aspartate kinase [Ruminococcaceae bacterium]|nr:aspartate kinase [Oscillospiraceae bacterium]
MKVIKFGGSSLADANQIKKVCDIVLADPARRLVVVSAPGKRNSEDTKVTDLLIKLAETSLADKNCSTELKAVVDRYASIAEDLGLDNEIIDEITKDLTKRVNSSKKNPGKYMDLLKAAGEDNSAKLVAAYLKSIGKNAEYIDPAVAGMILSDEFGNAQVLPKSYNKLARLAKKDSIMIFPGFFGYSETGEVVTFSRGGSDVTGGILAAAVNAELYENFTDVDSVYAANPNIVDNPTPIPMFSYEEMRELSYAGFSVLHEEALAPVFQKGITVNIKNTNNPAAPGTLIVPSYALNEEHKKFPVVGIAADKGFMTLHVSKYMMNREIGFGRKLLQVLEEAGISYEHTPSGIDSISVIIRDKYYDEAIFDKIIKQLYAELEVDKVTLEFDQAIVMIVGNGMTHSIGTAARAAFALSNANINLNMINQGSSEVSIMFGVDAKDAKASVQALYKEFFA